MRQLRHYLIERTTQLLGQLVCLSAANKWVNQFFFTSHLFTTEKDSKSSHTTIVRHTFIIESESMNL